MGYIKSFAKEYLKQKRHKRFEKISIKHKDVTILSNCCIGGTMYNDLGLKFLSPTINLFFGHHGFIDLVNHLDEYEDAQLVDTGRFDINENGLHGPICFLKKEGLPTIEIHFLHYASFEDAKKKWYLRYKRINKEKIYLVIEAKDEHEHALIDEYVALPYPKIIFTNGKTDIEKSIMHMALYDKRTNKSVTSLVGLKGNRGYDEFDFVNNIFNREYSERRE